MFALVLLLLSVEAVGAVEGTVFSGETPLPGCTITLSSAAVGVQKEAVSDGNGAYRIDGLPAGNYSVTFELQGLQKIERTISIVEGTNVLRNEDLRVDASTTMTFGCRDCSDEPPETPWDFPLCSDEELDDALIDAMEQGDTSAVAILRNRHEHASTYRQRHRLAAALLRRVPDDRAYWSELFSYAANVVRFAGGKDELFPSAALIRWCEEQALPPHDYAYTALRALDHISADPRSRALLLEALEGHDSSVIFTAISGLAQQRDESALPVMQRVLDARDDAYQLAFGLAYYRSEAADRLAMRHLEEEGRAEYRELREEVITPLPR
jgi:hypothetical protein